MMNSGNLGNLRYIVYSILQSAGDSETVDELAATADEELIAAYTIAQHCTFTGAHCRTLKR